MGGGPEKFQPVITMSNNNNHNLKPANDLVVGDLLRLPDLSPGDYVFSTKEQTLAWLSSLMGYYDRGDLHTEGEGGVTLQFVSEDTLRCIRVYDHPEPLKVLAMLKATCEAGGVTLLLNNALLTPQPDKEEAPKVSGPSTPGEPPSSPHRNGGVEASIGMEVA